MPDPDDPERVLEARALALLARREYTRAEMARRLARPTAAGKAAARRGRAEEFADEFAPPPPHADPLGALAESGDGGRDDELGDPVPLHPLLQQHIEAVLDRLEAGGQLSDARAAEAVVHVRAGQRGLMRVRQELQQRGVPADVAAQALTGLRDRQVPLAREVWRKRFGTLPADAAERARQTRFLAARGFSFEVIRAVLGGDES